MPSPRHTSKLEQTCQRDAFDSCSRAASGLEPGTAPPAPPERTGRGAGRARDAGPGIEPPRCRASARRRTSANRLSRCRRVRDVLRAGRLLRCDARSMFSAKARQAPGLRSESARSALRRSLPRRAQHEERARVAAPLRRRPGARLPDVRGSLRDMPKPSRTTTRPARAEGQGSSIRAQILTAARILLRTPRRADTARDRVLAVRIRCTARNSHRRLLQPETAGEAVLPRASARRTIIAA
jgi:hypothetical protein